MPNPARQHNPNFFDRGSDGSVKIRMKFKPEEASLIEEAAGDTPVVLWMHRAIGAAAKREVRALRRKRPKLAPPP